MSAVFVLILFAHVGPMGTGNSNALAATEFYTKESCEEAGKAAAHMAISTVKKIEFVCVKK